MTVVERRGVDDERGVGVEGDEVGVEARGDRPLAVGQADEPRGAAGHPSGQGVDGEPATSGLGPDGRQGELERGDPPPGAGHVAGLEVLQVRGGGRVVGADGVDQGVAQAEPEPLAVRALADGGCALEPWGRRRGSPPTRR